MNENACTRPPEGWWCSLGEGHDGPCPTHPYYGTPLEAILAPYLNTAQIAQVRADLETRITPEMAERQAVALNRILNRNARFREANGIEPCATPDCPGDSRYAAPGRGHIGECYFPLSSPLTDS